MTSEYFETVSLIYDTMTCEIIYFSHDISVEYIAIDSRVSLLPNGMHAILYSYRPTL